MAPEVFENWLTIGSIVGGVIAGWMLFWRKAYRDARSSERKQSEASPEVARRAVGAAFVDESTASAIIRMSHDQSKILKAVMEILALLVRGERRDEEEQQGERVKRDVIQELKDKGLLK